MVPSTSETSGLDMKKLLTSKKLMLSHNSSKKSMLALKREVINGNNLAAPRLLYTLGIHLPLILKRYEAFNCLYNIDLC